jgi:putative heme-binding domain-containing protein
MVPDKINKVLLVFTTSILLVGGNNVLAQEHSYAPVDIENGRGLYQVNCVGCHGDNGSEVEGANLATGRFRRASADEDLIVLIRGGIPNTLMVPRTNISYGDASALVAYLRSLSSGGGATPTDDREVLIGDATRGETIFNGNAQCATCHGVNGGGSPLSPDLGRVGAQRSPGSLKLSILAPAAEVRQGARFYEVVTVDGTSTVGKLLNHGTHTVQLMSEDERLVSFEKDKLSSFGFVASRMPSYEDILST